MTIAWTRPLRAATVTMLFLLTACAQNVLFPPSCPDDCAPCVKVCKTPTVRALADDLDHLEGHIEKHGSVVVQQPSIWAQARMTRHREEFERVMQGMLTQ